MAKDKKFGFGGKKRGSKQNTKESADDISEYNKFRRPAGGGGGGFKKKLGKGANKRPGKEKRMKMKNKKRK
jgi:rRNA-processing protein EBP2